MRKITNRLRQSNFGLGRNPLFLEYLKVLSVDLNSSFPSMPDYYRIRIKIYTQLLEYILLEELLTYIEYNM